MHVSRLNAWERSGMDGDRGLGWGSAGVQILARNGAADGDALLVCRQWSFVVAQSRDHDE